MLHFVILGEVTHTHTLDHTHTHTHTHTKSQTRISHFCTMACFKLDNLTLTTIIFSSGMTEVSRKMESEALAKSRFSKDWAVLVAKRENSNVIENLMTTDVDVTMCL